MARVDIGVTGGAPNLLGSLTAAARPVPEGIDWTAFGLDYTPENCGKPWVWQACTVAADIPAVECANAEFLLTISDADGGDLTVTFGAFTTAPIAYPPTDADVQIAIDNLPNVDPGDITVTGGPDVFTFAFEEAGQYGCTTVDPITADGSGLTGEGAAVQVDTVEPGNPSEPAQSAKPLNPGVVAVHFDPFLVEYNAASCDGIVTGGDTALLADRAKRGLQTRVSRAIALALSSSAPDGQPNDSPSLPTVAEDITAAGGAGELVCSLAGLIQDAYECGANGELFIHAPAWTLPLLLDKTQLVQVGNVWKLGPHTVVLDQGFSNEEPTGSTPADAGEAWFYVSGPVEVASGRVEILDDTTQGVDTRQNRANVITAEMAIYRFDPCCVKAALVSLCAAAA